MMAERLLRRYSAPLAALFVLLAAFAAPYLVPADPDSAVFRVGTLGALLLLACYVPVRAALGRRSLRELVYGFCLALVFAVCVELGTAGRAAHPFLYPAFAARRTDMTERIARAVIRRAESGGEG